MFGSNCLYLGNTDRFPDICRALDFLVKTTAKDGCRVMRTDALNLTEDNIRTLSETEHGLPSAHYNAYYHAALLLAYKYGGNRTYLDVGRRGLETIMFLGNRWGNSGNSDRLFFWAPKSLQMATAAMKLKDACSLEEKL